MYTGWGRYPEAKQEHRSRDRGSLWTKSVNSWKMTKPNGIRTRWEDVQFLSGKLVECGNIGLEVFGEDVLGNVGKPVGQEECRVLGECSVIKHLRRALVTVRRVKSKF